MPRNEKKERKSVRRNERNGRRRERKGGKRGTKRRRSGKRGGKKELGRAGVAPSPGLKEDHGRGAKVGGIGEAGAGVVIETGRHRFHNIDW